MQEIWVRPLGWKIPWGRERLPTPVFWPGEIHGPYSIGSQKVGQDWVTFTYFSLLFDLVEPTDLFIFNFFIFTVWITTNCGKFFKRWEYQTITLPAFWEVCVQVKKQQIEPDIEHWTGSKLGKEHVKAAYCHPAYLTSMQSTSCEILGWMKHKLESRLLGEISITSDMQMTPPLWQKAKRNWRASWWCWKRRVKKLP